MIGKYANHRKSIDVTDGLPSRPLLLPGVGPPGLKGIPVLGGMDTTGADDTAAAACGVIGAALAPGPLSAVGHVRIWLSKTDADEDAEAGVPVPPEAAEACPMPPGPAPVRKDDDDAEGRGSDVVV